MKINKILLIGNGFDLAHSLRTSYANFMRHILVLEFEKIIAHTRRYENYDSTLFLTQIDAYCSIESKLSQFLNTDFTRLSNIEIYKLGLRIPSIFQSSTGFQIFIKNHFLNEILNDGIINWVDLEDTYFNTLIKTTESNIDQLNQDFQSIKNLFEDYLQEQVIPHISSIEINKTILNIITCNITNEELSSIYISDIQKNDLDIEQKIRTKELQLKKLNHAITPTDRILYNSNYQSKKEEINFLNNEISLLKSELHTIETNKAENIFFINFNYTPTIERYQQEGATTIYIHGKLKSITNPIILGYGDERGDEYKLLESKSNTFLKNIKSFSYTNTTNYKDIMRIIESNPFQVIILGHACGVSDRVLLSTLFEHKNCISIKPYYYIDEDKHSDNYQDLVMNISRSFIDKTKMRDLIVDKTKTVPYSIIKTKQPIT